MYISCFGRRQRMTNCPCFFPWHYSMWNLIFHILHLFITVCVCENINVLYLKTSLCILKPTLQGSKGWGREFILAIVAGTGWKSSGWGLFFFFWQHKHWDLYKIWISQGPFLSCLCSCSVQRPGLTSCALERLLGVMAVSVSLAASWASLWWLE